MLFKNVVDKKKDCVVKYTNGMRANGAISLLFSWEGRDGIFAFLYN